MQDKALNTQTQQTAKPKSKKKGRKKKHKSVEVPECSNVAPANEENLDDLLKTMNINVVRVLSGAALGIMPSH